MYKLTEEGVYDIENQIFIPNCVENKDWQEYLKWIGEGNTPLPKD